MVKSARVVCSKNAILLPWTIATDPYVCPAYKQTNKRRTRAEIKSTDDEKKKTEERRNKKRTGKHKKEPRGETSASFIIAVVYRPARTKPLPSQAPPFFPFFCPLLLKLPSLHESLLFLLAAWNTSSFFTSFFFFFYIHPRHGTFNTQTRYLSVRSKHSSSKMMTTSLRRLCRLFSLIFLCVFASLADESEKRREKKY